MSNKYVVLSAEQKLVLATEILSFIETKHSTDSSAGLDEALAIALSAMTSLAYARTLLGTAS